jgi:23S rRNA pseudouridine1911/1915/1917 synthase
MSASPQPTRLDHAVAERLGVSHREARRLLDAGVVTLNGRAMTLADKGRSIDPADALDVAVDVDRVVAEPSALLAVVAEGDGWIVADKPAGQPVHPLRSGQTGAVLNAVVARFPQVQGVGEGGLRSGVVHRLDVGTSGCLAFALDQATWRAMREAFATHAVEKRYLAIVPGRMTRPHGSEALHLAVTRHRPARVASVDRGHPHARRCTLDWRVVESSDAASLVEVDLHTGFLHQVRATFAAMGRPLAGDVDYGGAPAIAGIAVDRPMLHAASLRWARVAAACPPPADFEAVRRRCTSR